MRLDRTSSRVLLFAVFAVFTGCGGGGDSAGPASPSPAAVARVDITPGTLSLVERSTASLTAVARDASGTAIERLMTWSSDNAAIATVAGDGRVTAVAVGTTTIDALAGGVHAKATVTVRQMPVGQVTVSLGALSLLSGQSTTATAVVKDSVGATVTNRAVSWTTSNASVATVTGAGAVTAVAPGTVSITATADGVSGNASLTVNPVPVARVFVLPPTTILLERATATLTAVARDSAGNALARPITWQSDNVAVVTVTGGVITGVAPGTTTVDASAEGVHGKATIVVRQVPVGAVAVSLVASSVTAGLTTAATAVVRDSLGVVVTNRSVVWTSSNTAVATVTGAGVVSAVASGTANITATAEGKSGSAPLLVTPPPVASVSVAAGQVNVVPGASTMVTATMRDAAGNVIAGRPVSFASSAPGVATVDASGLVRGVSAGAASIAATSEGRTASTIVQVTPALAPWVMRDSVVVLEYPSIYDVHPAPDPITSPNMRAQNAPV